MRLHRQVSRGGITATDKLLTLEEVLSGMKGNPNICLGAATSFLYIAPKDDMVGWLSMNYVQTQFDNQQNKDKKVPFLERKVLSVNWNDIPHNGYIVIVEGDEKGQYSTAFDITGQRRPMEGFDENGGLNLIASVLAEIASDLTDLEVFNQLYYNGKLNDKGESLLKKLEWQAQRSREFLRDEQKLTRWTDISGSYVEKLAMKNVENKISDIKNGIAKKSWDKTLQQTWNKFERDKILDMITADADPKDIFKAVGRGKNSKGSVKMLEDLKNAYEEDMREERCKYLEKLRKDIPLKEQMEGV